MKKFILIAAAILPLCGQELAKVDAAVQNLDLAFQAGFGNSVVGAGRILDEGFGNRMITGKPFSATEERHSLEVLGDGTRIENMQTNRLFRDADGRTRVEEMNGTVTINDPVAHVQIQLDPATKTAHKQTGRTFFYNSTANGVFQTGGFGYAYAFTTARPGQANLPAGVMSETTENLGMQQINGVTAEGVRTTMVIPKGQIGNNRDIKIVTEHWSSSDLQMLVKSANSDPRFGDTTYQLTKITHGAPDAALFQIPADYTVAEQRNPALIKAKPLTLTPTNPPGARGIPATPGGKQQ